MSFIDNVLDIYGEPPRFAKKDFNTSDFRGRFCIKIVPLTDNNYFYIEENVLT